MSKSEAEIYYRIDRQTLEAEKFEESNIELFEITIEEIDINSNIETVDKIAGGRAVYDNTAGAIVAVRDKITGEAEAIHDKIAEEVAELLVEQPIEAIIDKFAGDKAINDNTIDPSIELAVLPHPQY